MASAALSRRVGKVVAYPPLCELSDLQRRQFHETLLDADTFEGLPGKWQGAILKPEENRPNLRIVGSDQYEKFLMPPGNASSPFRSPLARGTDRAHRGLNLNPRSAGDEMLTARVVGCVLSQPMMAEEDVATGSLLCAIGNAGPPPVWKQQRGGFALFLFEHCLVAARATAMETWKAFKTPEGLSKPLNPELAQRMRLDAKGSRSISDLLDAHSANRVVSITAVREASLRRGRILSRLALTLTDGETLKWTWGSPNRPFEDVHRALRQMLGARLTVE